MIRLKNLLNELNISKDDMEKLHNDGEVEIDGQKITFQSETEVNEAPPKMKNSKEVDNIIKTMAVVSGLQKGGMESRYGKDFLKAKRKALKAINDMLTYAKIGV